MDANQRAIVYANAVSAMAANRAIIRLHAVLAAKGILGSGEIEGLRHLHLHDFDTLFDDTANAAARKQLSEDREILDGLWQSAVQWPLPGGAAKP